MKQYGVKTNEGDMVTFQLDDDVDSQLQLEIIKLYAMYYEDRMTTDEVVDILVDVFDKIELSVEQMYENQCRRD